MVRQWNWVAYPVVDELRRRQSSRTLLLETVSVPHGEGGRRADWPVGCTLPRLVFERGALRAKVPVLCLANLICALVAQCAKSSPESLVGGVLVKVPTFVKHGSYFECDPGTLATGCSWLFAF